MRDKKSVGIKEINKRTEQCGFNYKLYSKKINRKIFIIIIFIMKRIKSIKICS